MKRRKGFVFICGVCTFKFVVGDRNRVEFQSNQTNDSPGDKQILVNPEILRYILRNTKRTLDVKQMAKSSGSI